MPRYKGKHRKLKRIFAIEWEDGYTDIRVMMDDVVLGRIASKADLIEGRKFQIRDTEHVVKVWMDKTYPIGDVYMKVDTKMIRLSEKNRSILSFLWEFIDW